MQKKKKMLKKSVVPATRKKKALRTVTRPDENLYGRIRTILESARTHIARTVNSTQVIANWLIGREIVEVEQRGKQRAKYGQQEMAALSAKLQKEFGSGYSVPNLFLMRQFYTKYPALLIFYAPRRKSEGSEQIDTESAISHAVGDQLKSMAVKQTELTEIFYALRGISDATPQKSKTKVTRSQKQHAVRGELPQPGTLSPDLSWTHYRALIKIKRREMRDFYEIEAIKNNWSARQLERQISSLLFERLLKSRDKKGVIKLASKGIEPVAPIDTIKDPYVLEFLDLPEAHQLVESKVEEALITKLKDFLLELGTGFAFIGRQKRLTLDGDHFYSDLVFYHVKLKCYVIIDIKTHKLTHGDLGQMQMYVHYYDREIKSEEDNPTIGLILCTAKNDAMVKYVLDDKAKQIFASRYQFTLPTVDELKNEIKREMALLGIL